MPFTPEGFYSVAKKLSDREMPTGEGRYRTIVSRAYYGAYWATCLAVCRTHQINPPQSLPHEALCHKLAGMGHDEEIREFGTILDSLRLYRIHADYRLSRTLIEDYADDALGDARKAMDMLPGVESRLPIVDPAG